MKAFSLLLIAPAAVQAPRLAPHLRPSAIDLLVDAAAGWADVTARRRLLLLDRHLWNRSPRFL